MNKDEPSLLNHLNEVRKKLCPQDSGGISVIIYCGRVNIETNMIEALSIHRKIVEDEVNNEGCNITGLLIGQGSVILHLLEGPYVSVLNILKSLSEHSHFEHDGIQTGRIIYNVEDRPLRSYPEWYSSVIQERKSQIEDVTPDNCIDLTNELAMGLFEVGKAILSATGEVEINRYANNIPGKALLISFSNSPLFFPISEFVEVYADSYHVELESETNWPVEHLIWH
mmetsp:Transcript_10811/g.11232  ORF Transcript_10811/g.11232 Transcript_10811/m.11232 type:complete len:226 (-) Transcript_10811:68-745(-)